MKTVAFVPIKLNNERMPGKNTRQFTGGEPLIHYILATLLKVKCIDEIYVYCSDEKICAFLPKGVRFLKRDSYLDLSTTSFNEVLTSFAEKVVSDIYVLTHATAPFMKPESIEKGIEAVSSKYNDSAVAVQRIAEFLWKDGTPFNYDPERIPRTQDLAPMFIETCGLYVYGRDLILNERRRVGHSPFLVEVDKFEAIDINTPDDFKFADAVFNMFFR